MPSDIYAENHQKDSFDPRDYDNEHAHGGMSKWAYEDDPKRLAFTLARYKHTAKLLEGFDRVLEVGCGDGFGTRIVRQHVNALVAIDSDQRSIDEAQLASSKNWPVEFIQGDIRDRFTELPTFDAVYALDVLEHIAPDHEFLAALAAAAPVAVIGTPSKESQQYASRMSRLGHVNCRSGEDLRQHLLKYWDHVFLFTMHDEVLGTSFSPMAQYLLALCVGPSE